jgi:hypothetical protein
MNTGQWLYRYVYRGIGWAILAAAATVVAVTLMNSSSCGGRTSRAEDARQKAETGKILKRMHGNADEEIRKFNKSMLQKREAK